MRGVFFPRITMERRRNEAEMIAVSLADVGQVSRNDLCAHPFRVGGWA